MSTDPLKQAELNQIKNLEDKTGKKFEDWKKIVRGSGLEKHSEMVSMLKEKYGMGHGYANLLVHHAKQTHANASENEVDWVAEQYKGKEELKTWYDGLMAGISKFGNDVDISPKKAYVSLRRKKQFAIIQPSTKTRIDIGLNLKDVPAFGKLEASGSWNAMCTHRIKVEDKSTLDKQTLNWIKQAYEQAG
jgi:predicted transport protein